METTIAYKASTVYTRTPSSSESGAPYPTLSATRQRSEPPRVLD